MNYQFPIFAGEHALFEKDAFSGMIGQPFTVKIGEEEINSDSTLIVAEVLDEGKRALLTVDISSDLLSTILASEANRGRN